MASQRWSSGIITIIFTSLLLTGGFMLVGSTTLKLLFESKKVPEKARLSICAWPLPGAFDQTKRKLAFCPGGMRTADPISAARLRDTSLTPFDVQVSSYKIFKSLTSVPVEALIN